MEPVMVASDSMLGRLVLAARPTRPWLRLSLPERWARLLVAAGATSAATAPSPAQRRRATQGGWQPRFAMEFVRLQAGQAGTSEAAGDEAASGGMTWQLSDQTVMSAYSPAGLQQVEVGVVTTDPEWRDVLVPVRVSGVEYLLALGHVADGARGEVTAATGLDSAQIEAGAPRDPGSLTGVDVDVVVRSVAGASTASRALWVRIMERLAEPDPIRAAILSGLR